MAIEIIKIGLKEIKITAPIGLLPEEKLLNNRFLIDVEVSIEKQNQAINDSIKSTIDYVSLNNIVQNVFSSNCNLMETVAEKIIETIKLDYSNLKTIYLKISKLNPPINAQIHSSYVEYSVIL